MLQWHRHEKLRIVVMAVAAGLLLGGLVTLAAGLGRSTPHVPGTSARSMAAALASDEATVTPAPAPAKPKAKAKPKKAKKAKPARKKAKRRSATRSAPAVAALAGYVLLDQDLGGRELLAIAMVVVASAGAASLSHR